jgi:two-component system, cell cycle response regulator DivK
MATVLIIDDDRRVLDLMTEALGMAGHTVLAASSGLRGIELACNETPDVVLMDMAMPGMTGVEAVQRLREDPRTRKIPVVALTGGTSLAAGELIKAGCIGYIAKPVGIDELQRLVAGFVRVTAPRRVPVTT